MERNQIEYIKHFKDYLKNLPNLLTTLLGKIIPRNLMTGTRKPAQVLLPTEIGGSVKFLVGIAHPLINHTANWNDPTIQPTIVHPNQSNGRGNSDQNYSPIGSLDSGNDVRIGVSGWNINNLTGVKPHGPTGTMITNNNSVRNCDIFNYVIRNVRSCLQGFLVQWINNN